MTVKVVSLSRELAAMRLEINCSWQPKNSSIVSQGKRKNAAGDVNVCVLDSVKKGLKCPTQFLKVRFLGISISMVFNLSH